MINNFEKSARSNEIYRNVMATNNMVEQRIKIPVLKRAKKCSVLYVIHRNKEHKESMNRVQKNNPKKSS